MGEGCRVRVSGKDLTSRTVPLGPRERDRRSEGVCVCVCKRMSAGGKAKGKEEQIELNGVK